MQSIQIYIKLTLSTLACPGQDKKGRKELLIEQIQFFSI